MKGKINKNGHLEIRRGKKYKEQWCLYDHRDGTINCGDWCPQFGEPLVNLNNSMGRLNICQNRELEFKDFVDERK